MSGFDDVMGIRLVIVFMFIIGANDNKNVIIIAN